MDLGRHNLSSHRQHQIQYHPVTLSGKGKAQSLPAMRAKCGAPSLSQAPERAGRKPWRITGRKGTQRLCIFWVRGLSTERVELVHDHTQPGSGIVGSGTQASQFPAPHGERGWDPLGGGGVGLLPHSHQAALLKSVLRKRL